MSTPERIKQVHNQQKRLLKQMLSLDLMIPGAFREVHRKCGKQNCWCHDKPGHPLRRITWSEQGVSRSKAIPKKDVQWIRRATKNYKEFRAKRKQIQRLERDLKALLEAHQKEVVRKSRLLREYL